MFFILQNIIGGRYSCIRPLTQPPHTPYLWKHRHIWIFLSSCLVLFVLNKRKKSIILIEKRKKLACLNWIMGSYFEIQKKSQKSRNICCFYVLSNKSTHKLKDFAWAIKNWTEVEGSPKSTGLGQGPSLDSFTSRESVLKKTHHVGKTGSKYFDIYDQFSLLVTSIAEIPSQP